MTSCISFELSKIKRLICLKVSISSAVLVIVITEAVSLSLVNSVGLRCLYSKFKPNLISVRCRRNQSGSLETGLLLEK